jgi:hypothetical protein
MTASDSAGTSASAKSRDIASAEEAGSRLSGACVSLHDDLRACARHNGFQLFLLSRRDCKLVQRELQIV